jgi:hypothetical protein
MYIDKIRSALPLRAALALSLLAALAVAMVALQAVLPGGDAKAGAVKLTVNSTANTDDGDCDHPLVATDDCTLHEAIDAVNAGLGDTINFHPPVFSPSMPGVINIEGGEGCLPDIEREVTIDATNAGVVIDGDQDDDQTPTGCFAALFVSAAHNGFDFALMGGGPDQFIIRELNAEGAIELDGDALGGPFSFGDVLIDGIRIEDIEDDFTCCGDGISIFDTTNLNNVAITNNSIQTDGTDIYENAGDGVFMDTNFTPLVDNVVDVSGNQIQAGDDAVDISLNGAVNDEGDTPRKLAVSVSDNPLLTGGTGSFNRGVELSYCGGDSCSVDNSTINFAVNDNGEVTSENDGIGIEVNADDDSDSATVNVDVNGNANVDSGAETGVDISVDICCEQSDSTAVVNVNGNADVIGEDDAVEVNSNVCCADSNSSEVNVNENGLLQGEDEGVDIEANVGEVARDGDDDSDENTSEVNVMGNDRIDGGSEDGIAIGVDVGSEGGDADENVSDVTVSGNADVDGGPNGGDGINVDSEVGSSQGEADENESTVIIDANGDIDGGGSDGVEVDSTSGADDDGGTDGDNNTSSVEVTGNATVTGHDDDGVDIETFAGGDIDGSEINETNVTVTGNGDIRGQGGSNDDNGFSGDGLFIDSLVCCDDANRNNIDVNENTGEIVGLTGNGIYIFDLCCSFNTVNIMDNAGPVRGNDDTGINLEACDYTGDPEDIACLAGSVTIATITGNLISNSEADGIAICCGAFELTGVGKSVISDNTVTGNGDTGIELDSIFGMNVGPNNVVSGNGNNPEDAGIAVVNEASGGVWEDTEPGGNLCVGLGICDVVLPAHNNKITQNDVFDNVGLGIDLEGLNEPGGFYDDISRVGCISVDKAPFDPNDCIPFPTITIIAAGDKVGGTGCSQCTIELFLADATPDDQTGPLDVQHGEGKTYLVSGTADVAGNFTITLPCGLSAGDLTATATDKLKNTSEFAANRPFLGSAACTAPTATPTNTAVAAEPTATNTTAPPAATPQEKPCGDVNDDGSVDAIDASLILQLAAGQIDSLVNAESGDVNGDGAVTAIDASIILQLNAGVIDSLNC